MKIRAVVTVLSLLLIASVAQAQNNDAKVRKELVVSYHRMDLALSQPDGRKLIAVINDTLAKGPYRDLLIKRAEDTLAAGGDTERVHTNQIKTTITKLVVSGDTASVTVFQKGDLIQRDSDGEFGPKGAIHHLTGGANFLDKWVKQAGKWRLLSEAFISETMFVDGKKAPPLRD